jgi:hypothetical protein
MVKRWRQIPKSAATRNAIAARKQIADSTFSNVRLIVFFFV